MLPVVGLGTINLFDVASDPAKISGCTDTVRALVAGGGSLIDSSESYGASEEVLGDIFAATGLRSRVFLATKIDLKDYNQANGLTAMRGSLQRLKTDKVDLMQFHNVRDPNQDLGMLRDWKAQGLCRYAGITTTSEDSYDATVTILQREQPDFLMVDYAIDKLEAEKRVIPAAAAVGAGVLIALPFGRGRVFRNVLSKPLPDWTAEFDCASWAQFFLKFILGNPAVTNVAPGTDKPEHMTDDLGAGRGRLPDEKQRARMIQFVGSLG
jgi:aryl-alcohol dehydrogenase-like predicted oxidoreductase